MSRFRLLACPAGSVDNHPHFPTLFTDAPVEPSSFTITEVCMRRSRLAALPPTEPAPPGRLRGRLTATALLSVAVLVLSQAWAQQVPTKLPASPDPAAALELDQKVLATAKENSELVKNLTHLSDV